MIDITDYTFYRYLGQDTMISNGVRMQPREVVGLLPVSDNIYYIAHPKYPGAVVISSDSGHMIVENSRPFTASPNALFDSSFSFQPEGAEAPQQKEEPKPEPKSVPAPKSKPTPVAPEPVDDKTSDAIKAEERRVTAMPDFGNFKPLKYASAIYPGGTPNNYAIKQVKKCGKVHLEVMGIDKMDVPGINFKKNGVSPPDYVLKDIQENVMPGIGLNLALPFKRLYVGVTKEGNEVGGSHISTYSVRGFLYGAISIHPKQLVELLGGYNSLSMAHVITRELAHFVDHSMLRNVDRMKFDQAIRGKKIHPDSLNARTISSVPAEHFATLAELMVWGYSLRNVYTLNGVEIVSKYFENRYIPQSDIDSRKI